MKDVKILLKLLRVLLKILVLLGLELLPPSAVRSKDCNSNPSGTSSPNPIWISSPNWVRIIVDWGVYLVILVYNLS